MEFYISPENRPEVERKLSKMFKHLDVKPIITFSNVQKLIKQTVVVYGWYDACKYADKIEAIKVEIEDVETSDWVLVATVDYQHERMLICDAERFKNIPEQYGLEYTKCDHCGSTHKNRIESHILFNVRTLKWMQVGSTCINKMINGGKYLNGLMIKLYEVIQACGGCDGDGWYGGWWRPSSNFCQSAVHIVEAMMICKQYMENHGDTWHKAEYDAGYKVAEGTNDFLMDELAEERNGNLQVAVDKDFVEKIIEYWKNIEYGQVGYEKSLSQKIKDAFENEFITAAEMYLAWFAIMNYKNSITAASFEERIKELGIEKGVEFNFSGNLETINTYETVDFRGYDVIGYTAIFKDDATGLTFSKDISYPSVIDKFIDKDGKYKFSATVKFIAYKRQYVGFGGRLRKAK